MKSSKHTAVFFLVRSNFLNIKCYVRDERKGGTLSNSPEQESVDRRSEVVAEGCEGRLQLLPVDAAGLVPDREGV